MPPAAGSARLRDPIAPWVLVFLVPIVVEALYLLRYPLQDLNARGWDIFAYIWQTKAVGHASLTFIGTRPGLPVLASLLRSTVPVDPMQQLVVLSPLLVGIMGLAAAAVVRMVVRLPSWVVPVVAIVVSLWPSTGEFVAGYQANLLLLVLVAAGVGYLVLAQGRRHSLLVAVALFGAAALTHVAVYGVFVLVVGLAVLLALPAFARDRRQGLPVLATEAGSTVAAVAPPAVLGAATIFGGLRLSPGDAVNAETVSVFFRERTLAEVHRNLPSITLPVAAVGAATSWPNRMGRPAVALIRLAFAWSLVCAVGVVAAYLGAPVPGHRFVLFALPLPVLVGLGVAALGLVALRRYTRWRTVLAVTLMTAVVAGLASGPVSDMYGSVDPTRGRAWKQLAAAGEYISQLPPGEPVVFVLDQPGEWGAYTPKLRQYLARSTVPVDRIEDTFVYMGNITNLERLRPTLIQTVRLDWQRNFNILSRSLWDEVRPVLEGDPAVLVLEAFARADYKASMAADPGRRVSPGVYVLNGPVISTGPASLPGSIGFGGGLAAAVVYLFVLGLAGWGLASWGLRGTGATRLDRVCLAPAVGAAIGVCLAFFAALLGLNPHGPVGLAILVFAAGGGLMLTLAKPVGDRAAARSG